MRSSLRCGNPLVVMTSAGLLCFGLQAGLLSTTQFDGHTYQVWGNDGVVPHEFTYQVADGFASSLNLLGESGRLARIDSAEENAHVLAALQSVSAFWGGPVPDGGNARYAWIGADDLDDADTIQEGNWRWRNGGNAFWAGDETGAPVGGLYSNWAVGSGGSQSEPDDFFFNQDAAAMALDAYPVANPGLFGQPGEWNDLNANNQLMFVVEFAVVPESEWTVVATAAALGAFAWGRAHLRRRPS